MAFAFLTERLLLVGGFGDVEFNLSQPRLFVVDLDSSHGERIEFDEVEYLCAFLYPACYPWVHPLSFLIRSDPCTDWSPHPSVQVPFSIGPGPRLYIVTIWVMQGEEVSPIDLFVLSDTLLDHVHTLREGEIGHDFEWSEWGPAGTRMITQAPHSHVWVCYVFGTRFSSILGGGRENRQRESRILEVWDFNQLGIRRDVRREAELSEVEWHVGDTSVLSSRVFVGEVRTRLPYRVFRRKLDAPLEGEPVFTEAMCSEDSIILVDVSGLIQSVRYIRCKLFDSVAGTTLSGSDVLRGSRAEMRALFTCLSLIPIKLRGMCDCCSSRGLSSQQIQLTTCLAVTLSC